MSDVVTKQMENMVLGWRKDPFRFFAEVTNFKPSSQQADATKLLKKMVDAKIKASEGKKLTKDEEKLSKKRGISIMSGHGTGKDGWVANAILWFNTVYNPVTIPCTAPTADQLRVVLWKEIAKWANNGPLKDEYIIQSEKVHMRGFDKENQVISRTASVRPDGESETLAGFHDEYMMIVIEEASGVEEPVFKPLEGALTGKCNFTIMIFNPTRSSGYAYNSHYGEDKKYWERLHWNSEESSLVNPTQIEYYQNKYGVNHNQYRIRVLGLPPIDSEDTLIPTQWVNESIDRGKDLDEDYMKGIDEYPIILGMDCSGQGEDSAVIVARQGPMIVDVHVYDGARNTTEQAMWLLRLMEEYDAVAAFVDVIGVGMGVYDQARAMSYKVRSVNVANKSRKETKYSRLRDELWFILRQKFQDNLLVISDKIEQSRLEDLKFQISSPRFDDTYGAGKGLSKVESKMKMKKRGVSSPDMADAICLTFYCDDSEFMIKKDDRGRGQGEDDDEDEFGWMAA